LSPPADFGRFLALRDGINRGRNAELGMPGGYGCIRWCQGRIDDLAVLADEDLLAEGLVENPPLGVPAR
jgi:hypothetical protein